MILNKLVEIGPVVLGKIFKDVYYLCIEAILVMCPTSYK